MEIVEDEHERPLSRKPLEQFADRAVAAVALMPDNAVTLGRESQERRKHARQSRSDIVTERFEALRLDASQMLVERIDDHRERQVALELGRRSRQHQPARVRARLELGEQPGLSDSRLAHEHDRRGTTAV